jgi:hypothetical protein
MIPHGISSLWLLRNFSIKKYHRRERQGPKALLDIILFEIIEDFFGVVNAELNTCGF